MKQLLDNIVPIAFVAGAVALGFSGSSAAGFIPLMIIGAILTVS